jgi:putative transposase
VTRMPITVICQVLGLARRTAYYITRARADGRYHRAADPTVLEQIRAVTNSRATYGYRRVWAMVNRTFRTGYNRKRIRRVMQLHGLMLAPRVHRRHGRPHLGRIQQPASNQRWCSDVFLLPCWSGEVISVAFAIDCHDREVLAYIASPRPLTGGDISTLMDRALWARFGEATLKAPHAVQWLSDNVLSARGQSGERAQHSWSGSVSRRTGSAIVNAASPNGLPREEDPAAHSQHRVGGPEGPALTALNTA